MNRKRINEKGFTMVELVIVIAIMGIIGAVLVPSFSTMSTKAKISTDVATVKTLKRMADIYKVEIGEWPEDVEGTDAKTLVQKLKEKNYLDSEVKLKLGEFGAVIDNDGTTQTIKLDLTEVKDGTVIKALEQIDDETKGEWIKLPKKQE